LPGFGLPFRVGAVSFDFHVLQVNQRKTLAAPVIDEAVVRDRVEPGGEARLRRIAAACLDHAHPDVLEQLLGHAALLHAAQHEAEKARAVAPVEGLEGAGVAIAVSEHELFVGALHARSLPFHEMKRGRAGNGFSR
jgi:hypothetical protein